MPDYSPLTPDDTAIVLVDHQPGALTMATTYGVLLELYSDMSTEEGQRADAVASSSLSLVA